MNGQDLNAERRFWEIPDDGIRSTLTSLMAHALTRCMGLGRSDAPEPAYVTGGVKPRENAGTSRKSVLPAKRAGWRQMKPNPKEELGAPSFSHGEDVTKMERLFAEAGSFSLGERQNLPKNRLSILGFNVFITTLNNSTCAKIIINNVESFPLDNAMDKQ